MGRESPRRSARTAAGITFRPDNEGVQQVSPVMRYELTGPSSAPLVIVLGGISASRHITPNEIDGAAGWWPGSVGVGKGIDTGRFRILGVDYLDGGRGDDGRPLRTVTTHDQAAAIAEL